MKIKRWHVVVLVLLLLLCGALGYHLYTEKLSNAALQAVDFQALRAHTAELLENGFRENDPLFSSDYYDVRTDSTCYIWLNESAEGLDAPVSTALGYMNLRKMHPDSENKWTLRVELWQEGGARVRMEVDAKTKWACIQLMNQRIETLFTAFRVP